MSIPEAAVEAAGQALREAFDRGEGDFDEQARAAVKAAASHIAAEAWNLGLTAGIQSERGQVISNPYEAAK